MALNHLESYKVDAVRNFTYYLTWLYDTDVNLGPERVGNLLKVTWMEFFIGLHSCLIHPIPISYAFSCYQCTLGSGWDRETRNKVGYLNTLNPPYLLNHPSSQGKRVSLSAASETQTKLWSLVIHSLEYLSSARERLCFLPFFFPEPLHSSDSHFLSTDYVSGTLLAPSDMEWIEKTTVHSFQEKPVQDGELVANVQS